MLADTIQSFGNQCWIESSPFLTSTHLHVIPGPLNLDEIHHETTAFHPPYVNTKCCSSKFADQSNTVEIEPEQRFYINLAIYNQSKQPQTLSRGVVVTITPMTDVHRAELFVAASDTRELKQRRFSGRGDVKNDKDWNELLPFPPSLKIV